MRFRLTLPTPMMLVMLLLLFLWLRRRIGGVGVGGGGQSHGQPEGGYHINEKSRCCHGFRCRRRHCRCCYFGVVVVFGVGTWSGESHCAAAVVEAVRR